MSVKWFLSWVLLFPVLKFLTGIEIEGRVPRRGAFILASNHVSFLDPPAVGLSACREIYFLAKAGLFKGSKLFARLITAYNALTLEGMFGVRKAIRLFRAGNAVVIFPEGTRSRKKMILPFHQGVGYLAINFGVPVIPVYIANSNKRFITLVLRIHKLRVRFGKVISPRGYNKTKEDFARFATRVREEILRLQ